MAVTPADIAVALGRTAPEVGSPTFAQWEMWIEDAQNTILWRAEALGVTEPLDQDKVDTVVRKAVVRHSHNPGNEVQVQRSADDVSTMRTYRAGEGEVSIKPEWWALLGLVQDGAVGSFQLYGEPDSTAPEWWA